MPRSRSEPWTHDKGLAAQLHGRLRLLRNLCWAFLLGRLDHVANHGVDGSRLSPEFQETQLGQGGPAWSPEFRGAPPHDLGTAELAMARGVDKDIEVTLHLLDDWHRPTDQIVRVRMAPATARTLADRLWAVAGTAEIK